MTVLLRPAAATDQAGVGVLHHRSRADAYAHLVPAGTFPEHGHEPLAEWWAERFRWERDTHRMTVAEVGGELAGFTYTGPSETPGAAELYAIHVAPERVGTGVGRRLMMHALAELPAFGGDRAVLWVLSGNRVARRFYEHGGWAADGGTRVAPINDTPLPQLRYTHPL
ncbi:GNAT family N-acetyltransferase [Actinoplanes teichomyceticus]|uniref:Ribosomal protein S18 acetylase RimI-like enzyme n=1 Tax=Actinoplanes teichomyceticus TaxID=1867 RepID=A0A561VQ40_ACTTI|nr:GNAT family N-acetyltransferase [Actinoplanes teichomyceticus]TWG13733.1 ribosomal protein S18 acetylase RimI-like enzyme [Actinoplanes teichomyceticus]GIF12442.1 N-acetyltransferase [Actinoplanes teichomyceticus]